MGADRLAFRTRPAFAGAAVELRAHGRVLDLGGVDVTDPWLRHRFFLRFLLRLEVRGGYALFTMSRKRIGMLPHGHSAINRARALFTARFPGETAASGRACMLAAQPRRGAGPPRRRGLARDFLTIVT